MPILLAKQPLRFKLLKIKKVPKKNGELIMVLTIERMTRENPPMAKKKAPAYMERA
jgi:hypothetical protein